MPGRRLITDSEAARRGFGNANCARRRRVLCETIEALSDGARAVGYRHLARSNLARWSAERRASPAQLEVQVLCGD